MRWAMIGLLLFTIAIPLIGVNLLARFPNHMWMIFSGALIAIIGTRIVFVALNRRALASRRSCPTDAAGQRFSN
jgi:putative Mn2+ efflux pump MntP